MYPAHSNERIVSHIEISTTYTTIVKMMPIHTALHAFVLPSKSIWIWILIWIYLK